MIATTTHHVGRDRTALTPVPTAILPGTSRSVPDEAAVVAPLDRPAAS